MSVNLQTKGNTMRKQLMTITAAALLFMPAMAKDKVITH